jgi:uncharacterized protein
MGQVRSGPGHSRRGFLRGIGGLGIAGALGACTTSYPSLRLTVATGSKQGVYYTVGTALATAWADELRPDAPVTVRSTAGSVDNLQLLARRSADVAFSQIDTAAEQLAVTSATDPAAPRALARIYDDVVHVVVPATSDVQSLAGLRGRRVSVGAPDSGVFFIAKRVLQAVGISVTEGVVPTYLPLDDSARALREGRIDAFFWSGGLPTRGITDLATTTPIRLVDIKGDELKHVRDVYPVYTPGTVPVGTYGPSGTAAAEVRAPVTTLLVRNVLVVRAEMREPVAHDLAMALFQRQPQIAAASPAALTIDPRSAIGTEPVPLHPGAERWFREARDGA